MRSGETVLVTAAAGGVGQFVVQLAKQAGNTVIATCGSEDKARLLQRLGADRIVNYRQESLKEVLGKEYPKVNMPAGAGQSWVVLWPSWPALRVYWQGLHEAESHQFLSNWAALCGVPTLPCLAQST